MPAMRRVFVVLFCLALPLLAATPKSSSKPKKKKTTPPAAVHVSPDEIPHAVALFLRTLSSDGRHTVAFKATAVGTRFFFEENGSVTVYQFVKGTYVREDVMKGTTLARAVKKYVK